MVVLEFKHGDEQMWMFWGGLFSEGDKLVIECVLSVNMYSQTKFVQIFTGFMFPTISKSHYFKIPHKIPSATQPKG